MSLASIWLLCVMWHGRHERYGSQGTRESYLCDAHASWTTLCCTTLCLTMLRHTMFDERVTDTGERCHQWNRATFGCVGTCPLSPLYTCRQSSCWCPGRGRSVSQGGGWGASRLWLACLHCLPFTRSGRWWLRGSMQGDSWDWYQCSPAFECARWHAKELASSHAHASALLHRDGERKTLTGRRSCSQTSYRVSPQGPRCQIPRSTS